MQVARSCHPINNFTLLNEMSFKLPMGLGGTVDTGLIQVQRAHTNYILSTYCLNFSPANVAKVWVLKYIGGFFFWCFFW